MTPTTTAASILSSVPSQLSAALSFESSLEDHEGPHLIHQNAFPNLSSEEIIGDAQSERHSNSDDNTGLLADQLDDLTIESTYISTQATSTTLPSILQNNNGADSVPGVILPEISTQRISETHTNQDRSHNQVEALEIVQGNEESTISVPTALLLAQPLSFVLDESQSSSRSLSPDSNFTSLQQLRAPTPLNLEHLHDCPIYAQDHLQNQNGLNYNNSNTMDFTFGATNINSFRSSDNMSIAQGTSQENSTNGHIIESSLSYQLPTFISVESQDLFSSNTYRALSQVLTSFQDATVEQDHVQSVSQIANYITMDSNATPTIDPIPIFTGESTVPPVRLLRPSQPSQLVDESISLPIDNISAFPQASLSRRRYATRDYSTGSVSSDDWLHHPDVVAFNIQDTAQGTTDSAAAMDTSLNNANVLTLPTSISITAETPLPLIGRHLNPLSVNQADPRETPVQREQSTDSVLNQNTVSMSVDTLSSAAAEAIISSTLTDSNETVQEPSRGPSGIVDIDNQVAARSGSPLETDLDSLQSDRLGLLGPLLAGTENLSLPPSGHENLGFSLLSSSSRRTQGFDSSILSMTSRIRQARLTRILRLMREHDHWNRFSPVDTRSMINHASISRGTSRAGSLVEDNHAEQNLESDLHDSREDGRPTMRHRNDLSFLQTYSTHYPTYTEILDCNGNPLDSGSNSYASSSSGSSMTSNDTLDEHDEDTEWLSGVERRRRRRTGWDDLGWSQGIVRNQGRPRVVSTGTAFEGLEYISQTDNLLNENNRCRSLKASWVTNPNGESWSDDECDDPQRKHYNQDHDDKDADNAFLRRNPPSIGMVPSYIESSSAGGLYYIFGNVRNRYGSDNIRRRRVMSDMSMLLRREQEWERELERYNREMTESQLNSGVNYTNSQGTREDGSDPMTMNTVFNAAPTMYTRSAVDANENGLMSETGFSSDNAASRADGTPNLAYSNSVPSSLWPRSNTSLSSDPNFRLIQEFRDYEQGHSHYHTQNEPVSDQSQQRADRMNDEHSPYNPHQSQQHQQRNRPMLQQATNQAIAHQPIVMNRTPPLLPPLPHANEPIAHQIRRAHNAHIMGLHRRWELQQQFLRRQYELTHLDHSTNGNRTTDNYGRDRNRFQRYSNTTFMPPPSRQQPQNHPNHSHISTFNAESNFHAAAPMSRGSRSSFRTSHETNGFQHFNLTENNVSHQIHPPQRLHTSSTNTLSMIDSNMFSSSLDGRFPERFGPSSLDLRDSSSLPFTEQLELGAGVGVPIMHSNGAMLSAVTDMQDGNEDLGVPGSASSTTVGGALNTTSSPNIGSLTLRSLSDTPTIAISSTTVQSSNLTQQQQHHLQSSPLDSLENQQLYRRTRWRGSNTLYVNYEGGILKPEERWRRGEEERIGR
ncbi:hypothetical protein FBU30_005277 [Linnemannia zychae]|nr:hypothetical protein FBU30_005277 [Linnemannia zychae]